MDNGPEFVVATVRDWCRFNSAHTIFIQPGSPWRNAWIELFNARTRDELLNIEQFDSLLEAKALIEDWRIDYSTPQTPQLPRPAHPHRLRQAWTNNHQQLSQPADH